MIISIHTPPRGATSSISLINCSIYVISIHAPPRGATKFCLRCGSRTGISIHAPPRGATALSPRWLRICLFQFTPLREGRLAAWRSACTRHYFNSRPSARGDEKQRRTRAATTFQFTPLREGRPEMTESCTQSINFNSRPSARGDVRWITIKKTRRNFNSRPSARGDGEVLPTIL